ncbi:competence protein ComA, partial [Burkholderia pseudomultivorans]|uniref:competence protein ComA n=1 Tax=Burkholderia pseudomultivorans TaxID=1207504 RepID=UPI001E5EEB09
SPAGSSSSCRQSYATASGASPEIRSAACRAASATSARPARSSVATCISSSRSAITPRASQRTPAAERISGLAPDAVAYDWRQDDDEPAGEIAVAAAPLALLERRIDVAAQAGIDLTAVDGESAAALRALRYAAQFELDAQGAYAALWFSDTGVRGWRVDGALASPALALSTGMTAAFAEALRHGTLGSARCVLVAGDERSIGRFGLSIADIGDVLGANAVPFDCIGWDGRPSAPAGASSCPAFAVAFGLALRGVWE